jgi:hypothetical protein
MPEGLDERRRALEDAFYREKDAPLRDSLRMRREHEEHRRELARACGIHDDEALDALLRMGVEAETVAALALVPLVAVAWADGVLEAAERRAVLRAAEQSGVAKESYARALLEGWLDIQPGPALLDAFLDYVACLAPHLEPAWRDAMRRECLGRTQSVAEISGGILGRGGGVRPREQRILERIEKAFADGGG